MREVFLRVCCGLVSCSVLLVLFLGLGCGEDAREPSPPPATATYDGDGFLRSEAQRPADAPNVVILLLDTLRADALALPGSDVETHMPYLSKLARDGVSFSNATSPAPWTMPSVTSMLTGVMPTTHRVDSLLRPPALQGAQTTFAEALRNGYGYETLAFASGTWFDQPSSIWQGFRTQQAGFAMRGARSLLEKFATSLDRSQPFFLFLHSFEAHDPYGRENHPFPKPVAMAPPPGYDPSKVRSVKQQAFDFLTSRAKRLSLRRIWGKAYLRNVVRYLHAGYGEAPDVEMAAALRDAYFDGVRWVDTLVERTVGLLHEWALLDDTLLIITSDHGEAFGEHGTLEHGRQLYDELVRVPLVMIDFRKDASKQRFRGGRVFHGPVATLDLLPTFFDYAGLRPLDDIPARSFLDVIVADERDAGTPVFSEERLDEGNTIRDVDTKLYSVRTPRWKYILTFDRIQNSVQEQLYDLQADPGEQDDLVPARSLAKRTLDVQTCQAIEGVRDAVWGSVAGAPRLPSTPYADAPARLDPSTRPAACGSEAP